MRTPAALFAAATGLFVLTSTGMSQTVGRGAHSRPQPRQVVVSDAPVTGEEARKIFLKVESAFRKVIPSLPKGQGTKLRGNQPASRSAIVVEMDRLFQIAKPSFKSSPKKAMFDAAKLSIKDAGAKEKLASLVAWGFVEADSPVASSTKDTLGVLEFGDAVGVFIKRISELSHTPSDKFSPDRMKSTEKNDPAAGVGKSGG